MINLYIFLSIIFWASSFVGIRAAITDFSPIEIAVLRFIVSSIALLLISISQKTILPKKKNLFLFIQLGFVLFVNHISLNFGIRTITAGETTLIVSTSQIFQVLLAYLFLKENVSGRFLVGLLFCFLGVSIIAFQKSIGMSFNLGVSLVVIAAVTNAAFFVLQKPLLRRDDPAGAREDGQAAVGRGGRPGDDRLRTHRAFLRAHHRAGLRRGTGADRGAGAAVQLSLEPGGRAAAVSADRRAVADPVSRAHR